MGMYQRRYVGRKLACNLKTYFAFHHELIDYILDYILFLVSHFITSLLIIY